MFSNSGGIHIPVSGGAPWIRVPMNSNYPSQRIEIDGNMYAPVSEVHKPRTSVPIISTTNTSVVQDSTAYNPASLYVDGLYNSTPESRMNYYIRQEQQAKEEAARQQEALITANINKQLDIATSTQYRIMDKLYIEGGLDAMRKEYYRLSAGTEGYNSVYAKAAYNALCAKDKEESLNTPTITKVANESYERGGINSLTGLVNYYENNGYPVHANIAKSILKQKEEQRIAIEEKEREEEHNRRMQQDPEYAENYKIKEAEYEISKLEKEIKELSERDSFAGQQLNAAVIGRKKAFEYSKNLGYEGAKTYLKELQLPVNERFFDARVGASEAVSIFDKIIPLQNKIEQAKAKIQEIENVRTERIFKQKEEQEQERERTKQLLAKAEREIEGLILQEINLQMPIADEAQLRKIIREKLEEYPTPESRREFIETLPDDVKLRAMQYTLPESSDGYQTVSAGVIGGLTTLIGAIAIFGIEAYRDSIRDRQSYQSKEKFDETVYEPLDHSLDTGRERNNSYQPGMEHGADQGDRPTGFLPQFNRDRELGRTIQPVPNHPELRPGNDQGFPFVKVQSNPLGTGIERDKVFLETLHIYKAVKDLQVGRYGDLQRDADPYDGMHHDHWPSVAAIIKNKESQIGEKLSAELRAEIIRNTNAIVIVEELHRQSRTYGGKNTSLQIVEDAEDLAVAASKDAEIFRENAIKKGYDPTEIDSAIRRMHELNRKCGLY